MAQASAPTFLLDKPEQNLTSPPPKAVGYLPPSLIQSQPNDPLSKP
jgi:hypothetical protein